MLRDDTMLCLGTLIEPSRCSISTQSTPNRPSSQASASPTGPAPAMITEVSASALLIAPVSPLLPRLQPLQKCELARPLALDLIRIGGCYRVHLREFVLPVERPHRIDDDAAVGDAAGLARTGRQCRIDIAGPAAVDDVGLGFRVPAGGERPHHLGRVGDVDVVV